MIKFLLLMLSIISFNSYSMERIERLAALPVEVEHEGMLISFEQLPNPSEPAPMHPLRLWQSEHDQAQLKLPLVEANIKFLEKKHGKEKKAFNEKREKVANQAMYAAGYLTLCMIIKKVVEGNGKKLSVVNYPLDVLLQGITLHGRMAETTPSFFEKVVNDLTEYGFAFSALLATKNAVQTLWQSPNLFGSPKESGELLAARNQRNQLLLTLQQAPEQK